MLLCCDVQVDRMREQLAAKDAAMLAAQPPLVRDLQVCTTPGSMRAWCQPAPDWLLMWLRFLVGLGSEEAHCMDQSGSRVWPCDICQCQICSADIVVMEHCSWRRRCRRIQRSLPRLWPQYPPPSSTS
jgi:hypothetical protein